MIWNVLVAEIVNGQWRPGIGDPTVLGWMTVAAYLLAALLCGRVMLLRRVMVSRGARVSVPFWSVLVVLLLLLGINKQLDLQSLITVLGKNLARAQGWYGQRRKYQVLFVVLVGVLGVLGIVVLGWMSRGASWSCWLALVGIVYLFAFVAIRAASFHHVDRFLKFPLGGTRVNVLLELGGIACIAIAALAEARASGAGQAFSRESNTGMHGRAAWTCRTVDGGND